LSGNPTPDDLLVCPTCSLHFNVELTLEDGNCDPSPYPNTFLQVWALDGDSLYTYSPDAEEFVQVIESGTFNSGDETYGGSFWLSESDPLIWVDISLAW